MLSKNDDEIRLEEALRAEKMSMKEYEERINKNIFPSHIKIVLEEQLSKLKEALDRVKTTKDLIVE